MSAMLQANAAHGVQGQSWRVLGLVCVGIVLSMTSWFSATAITPSLIGVFTLSAGDASWLTNMVQLGFVVGALGSSVVSLPDLMRLRWLMGAAGVMAALCNLALLWVPGRTGCFWRAFSPALRWRGFIRRR